MPFPDLFSGTATSTSAGSTLRIEFDDPSRPNTEIEITVRNGAPEVLKVTTDGDGHAETDWAVPDAEEWFGILVREPGSADHAVAIT